MQPWVKAGLLAALALILGGLTLVGYVSGMVLREVFAFLKTTL